MSHLQRTLFALFVSLSVASFISCSSSDGDGPDGSGEITYNNIYRGDIVLYTQAQVNVFGKLGYDKIEGTLTIRDFSDVIDPNYDITTLEPLKDIKYVEELRLIKCKFIENFEELTELRSLDYLLVLDSDLKDFKGLERVDDLIGFTVQNVTSLKNFEGLENLGRVKVDFYVYDNLDLKDFQGLNSLTTLGSSYIRNNQSLLDFEGLGNVELMSSLFVSYNPSLVNFNGLGAVNELSSLRVINNSSLENFIGLEQLLTIERDLFVKDNELLANFEGFSNLERVRFDFIIENNSSLVNLSGLDALESNAELVIRDNPILNSIQSLNKVNYFSELRIVANDSIVNLEGLENVDLINTLIIRDNSFLIDFCALQTVDTEYYDVGNNAYNPVKIQLISGECRQP